VQADHVEHERSALRTLGCRRAYGHIAGDDPDTRSRRPGAEESQEGCAEKGSGKSHGGDEGFSVA
jgi:hypothetical protein